VSGKGNEGPRFTSSSSFASLKPKRGKPSKSLCRCCANTASLTSPSAKDFLQALSKASQQGYAIQMGVIYLRMNSLPQAGNHPRGCRRGLLCARARLHQHAAFTAFKGADHFYGVAFHELTYWKGHKARLDRDLKGRFGQAAYAAEELRGVRCCVPRCRVQL
jgi:hypothetical protein